MLFSKYASHNICGRLQ
ncbi:hypothetical protein M8C21_008181 [Ambrosia artemisiifolia]|uniref:Uncharacterized protein n=1 Tax=Ambrosia artemisiifolia TaxID=4212 RepID=A0AAD5C1M6_AMBAR|nr:hypothetical protein M8C21_008181 [Ambrosia artemisiifolia]